MVDKELELYSDALEKINTEDVKVINGEKKGARTVELFFSFDIM